MKTFKQYIQESNAYVENIRDVEKFLESWGYERTDYEELPPDGDTPVIKMKMGFSSKYAAYQEVRALEKFPFKLTEVGGDLYLSGMRNLMSLAELPKMCPWGLMLDGPDVNTLEGGPEAVGVSLMLSNLNELKSLKGCPQPIADPLTKLSLFNLDSVTSLDGIGDCKVLHIMGSRVKMSLKGIEKFCPSLEQLMLENAEITDTVLGLLEIENLVKIRSSTSHDWVDIVNSHLKMRDRDVFKCQEELLEAGFDKLAEY